MTDTPLFDHFATLATAPDGIARLRELILQLAVQGKLGTQDPGDEPASVLLGKIKNQIGHSENQKKHGKELSEIEPDKIPFDLPNNWIWTQIGSICTSPQYGWTTQGSTTGETYLLRTTDITSGRINWDTVPFCSEVPSDLDKYLISDGDIVVSRAGSVGMSHLITNPKKAVFASYLIRFKPMINREYFALFLKSPYYWGVISEESLGTGVPNVNATKLKNCYFPLPPLAEQHRIVAKVDRLMALCDELEARQQQERAGCLKLGTASLAGLQNAASPEEFERQWAQVCDAFDLILDCPENVAVLRQTIFYLAVHGRLMQQMPGDEPAEKLLERIRKEKERLVKEGGIKREKPLEPVRDDEVPFILPDSWKWVRINDAAKIVEYGTSEKAMSSPTVYGKDSVPVFRMNNIQNGKVIHENLKYLPNSIEGLPHLYLQNNDILINRTNSYELVGKSGIFKGENDKFTFASYLIRISFFPQSVDSDFVNIALNSSYFRTSQIEPQVTQQCGQANFSGSKIKNALIPLPPLAEQHRIVAKVDALMALCDELDARLKERAAVQGMFAGAVVKRVCWRLNFVRFYGVDCCLNRR